MNLHINSIITLIAFVSLNFDIVHGGKSSVSKDKSKESISMSGSGTNNLEQQGGILEISLTHSYPDDRERDFKIFSYSINSEQRNRLNYPCSVGFVKFSDRMMEFEDPRTLPDRIIWSSIGLFICRHNYPLMVGIKVIEDEFGYHYYYTLDPETGKLKNDRITTLNQCPENDGNGLIRYPMPQYSVPGNLCENIQKMWKSKFEVVCKYHDNVNDTLDKPPLGLIIVSIESEEDKNKRKAQMAREEVVKSHSAPSETSKSELYPTISPANKTVQSNPSQTEAYPNTVTNNDRIPLYPTIPSSTGQDGVDINELLHKNQVLKEHEYQSPGELFPPVTHGVQHQSYEQENLQGYEQYQQHIEVPQEYIQPVTQGIQYPQTYQHVYIQPNIPSQVYPQHYSFPESQNVQYQQFPQPQPYGQPQINYPIYAQPQPYPQVYIHAQPQGVQYQSNLHPYNQNDVYRQPMTQGVQYQQYPQENYQENPQTVYGQPQTYPQVQTQYYDQYNNNLRNASGGY